MNKVTLNEAIRILDRHYILRLGVRKAELDEAARIGIEALKAWQECRDKGLVPLGWVLPGELV